MSKRKIEVKGETIIPELNVRKSRRTENTLAVKPDNIKIMKNNLQINKNDNSNLINIEISQSQVVRRSNRLKENISPATDTSVLFKVPNIAKKQRKSTTNNEMDIIVPKAVKVKKQTEKKLDVSDQTQKADLKNEKVRDQTRNADLKNKVKKENVSDQASKSDNKNKVKKEKESNYVKQKPSRFDNTEIPVDKVCETKVGTASVYTDEINIYDVMLNQTNLQFNNNKFYIIQLLKDNDKEVYSVWMRWARVGKIGQMKLSSFGSNLEAAKSCFCQKFYDKTRNRWEELDEFVKVDGKYDLVHIDYAKREKIEPKEEGKKIKLEPLECKLDEKLQDLLKTIFDIKEMNSAVSDLNYDSDRLPLGRLTEAQIMAGYKALREIEGLLNEGYSTNNKLMAACNAYYTRIPHDFGMRVPPIIRSLVDIKKELELLETLSDIKITLGLMELGDINTHHLDRQYLSLKCDIRPVNTDEPIYELLNSYLLKTHGTTHNEYSLEMLELYEVKKENEWKDFEDVGNRMLLWHGSRTTNYGGILSQGLRIAPKEAPVTGHMFGKGVYFSDMSSKSANYIYPTKAKNVGFMMLCEVSLGNCNELIKANEKAASLPKNMNSVMGKGRIAPDRSTWTTTVDGVVVPVGEPIETDVAEKNKGYVLNYNEYIVYNRKQIRMRYMIKVRFNYKETKRTIR